MHEHETVRMWPLPWALKLPDLAVCFDSVVSCFPIWMQDCLALGVGVGWLVETLEACLDLRRRETVLLAISLLTEFLRIVLTDVFESSIMCLVQRQCRHFPSNTKFGTLLVSQPRDEPWLHARPDMRRPEIGRSNQQFSAQQHFSGDSLVRTQTSWRRLIVVEARSDLQK